MPQEHRINYRAHYEDEAPSVSERLEDAARANAPSILAEAIKEEYGAASDCARLNYNPEKKTS